MENEPVQLRILHKVMKVQGPGAKVTEGDSSEGTESNVSG